MGNKEHWTKNNQDATNTNTVVPGEQEKKTVPRQRETNKNKKMLTLVVNDDDVSLGELLLFGILVRRHFVILYVTSGCKWHQLPSASHCK